MRDYHLNVLGLSGNPTQKDIKAAYRRMSKKYHPDLNPSADAVDRFIEIDKAYDYLTTSIREPILQESVTDQEYDPRQEWKERIRRKAWEEEQARKDLIKSVLRPLDYVFYVIVLLNVLLIVDIVLPKKSVERELVKVVIGMDRQSEGYVEIYPYDDVYFSDYFMRVDKELVSWPSPGTLFTLSVSRIFDVPVSMQESTKELKIAPSVGPFHFWVFLIPLILITWLVYRFAQLTNDHRLTLAIFLLVPIILQVNVLFRYT